jgi:hypothetical protein
MMEKLLGDSPVPTILGYTAGILLDARVIFESGGMPDTFGGWSTLVFGLLIAALGRSSKQVNVTNANDAATIPSHTAEVKK